MSEMSTFSHENGLTSPIQPKSTEGNSPQVGKESKEISSNQSSFSTNSQTRYDLQILRSLRRIIRAIDIHSRKLKSEYELTAPQLICLLEVVENSPLSASKIAQNVHLSPSTIVGILDRLEKKGLIQRTRNVKDRRLVDVTATENGRQLAGHAPSPLQDGLASALKRLTALEQATIALSLERIVELMEAREIDAAPILETGQLDQDITSNNPSAAGVE